MLSAFTKMTCDLVRVYNDFMSWIFPNKNSNLSTKA